jgi:hypothetical protein
MDPGIQMGFCPTWVHLAEPRPVLRGLRPRLHGPPRGRSRLAEPRPVLRGLRRRRAGKDAHSPLCRAETRSQGIATSMAALSGRLNPSQNTCRAETRSQGIATWPSGAFETAPPPCRAGSQGIASSRWWQATLAEPRPVLRGLRPCPPGHHRAGPANLRLAEPRPVLRGLRQGQNVRVGSDLHLPGACRAETRSQGIATLSIAAHDGPLARGTCRAETRSQGIATGCGRPGHRGSAPSSCRAETRSQGIATEDRRRYK